MAYPHEAASSGPQPAHLAPDSEPTGSGPDARGPRLASVVVFVHDHDASADFYGELLNMKVTVRTSTAALLVSRNGFQVYLRAVGAHAIHPTGHVGAHYVIWTADGPDDFQRCERVLRARSDRVDTREAEGFTLLEGRDPSGLPVLVAYPGPDEVARLEIISRYYV
ncbi:MULTISPECIES: VOC family protein [unclassified Streptomyces]|uniref:VOC family protein n=1 Tax=unclassified Streptomyces TaxID=2593676 RepID=UPI00224E18AF|nr:MULTISPECIES: VOC family protein [unclassified Streptomyces]MCX5052149.1 VOC family protein [Streptomyces sp. NBC_00474]MCX5063453.1 VOC family protein [Streptomyces sp. NBC_00452]MCX5251307.1 VOC family protein [Streptomyces sp. NBC_00201]MCX5294770.1 VOC family protein [Streptomyces sp. NBC_00183]